MNDNRMSFEEFQDHVITHIRDHLSEDYKDASVNMVQVMKQGKTYDSMQVARPGEQLVPSINLSRFYEDYTKGQPMDQVMEEISAFTDLPVPQIPVQDMGDHEKMKGSLFIKVCDIEANRDYLKGIPYQEVDGLAITPHLLLDGYGKDSQVVVSAPVTKELAAQWRIPEEQLMKEAFANAPGLVPAWCIPMDGFLKIAAEQMGEILPEEDFALPKIPMMIVTNTKQVDGAAIAFYPGILETMAQEAGSDLYVLPSSRHEMILISADMVENRQDLSIVLQEANRNVVAPEDRLSDHVYYYDAKEKVFERAETHEMRLAQEKPAVKGEKQDRGYKAGRDGRQEEPERKSVLGRLNEKKAQVAARSPSRTGSRAKDMAME